MSWLSWMSKFKVSKDTTDILSLLWWILLRKIFQNMNNFKFNVEVGGKKLFRNKWIWGPLFIFFSKWSSQSPEARFQSLNATNKGDFFYKCVKNSPGAQEVRRCRNPFGCQLFSVVFRDIKAERNRRVFKGELAPLQWPNKHGSSCLKRFGKRWELWAPEGRRMRRNAPRLPRGGWNRCRPIEFNFCTELVERTALGFSRS